MAMNDINDDANAFRGGYEACRAGRRTRDNPYKIDRHLRAKWAEGFAHRASQEAGEAIARHARSAP